MRTPTPALIPALLSASLAGCFPAKAPMKTSFFEGADDTRTLMVMLPGFGAHDTTFDKRGVIDAAREAGLEADIVSADLTYGYYISERWEDRMREDVFDVYADRYDHIWLMGISMGGMGALLTTRAFHDQIDGVVILSPFLGRRKTLRALQRDTLKDWSAPTEAPLWDEMLWTWMKEWARRDWAQPPLYLGHGDSDLGMKNLTWMASLLPEERVEVVPGGHTWPVWGELASIILRDHILGRYPGFGGEADEDPAPETEEPAPEAEPSDSLEDGPSVDTTDLP